MLIECKRCRYVQSSDSFCTCPLTASSPGVLRLFDLSSESLGAPLDLKESAAGGDLLGSFPAQIREELWSVLSFMRLFLKHPWKNSGITTLENEEGLKIEPFFTPSLLLFLNRINRNYGSWDRRI